LEMKKRHSEAHGKGNFSTSYSQCIPNNFLGIFCDKCHRTVTLSLIPVKARFPQSQCAYIDFLKKRYV
jgi:hypothetical protein